MFKPLGFALMIGASLSGWIVSAQIEAGGPAIGDLELTPNPSGRVPLAALLTVSTGAPARISVKVDTEAAAWTIAPDSEFKTSHSVAVLGLRPGKTHRITVVATGRDGRTREAGPLELTTPELPEIFPPLEVTIRKPEKMEPGFTLFNAYRWPDLGGTDPDYGLLLAVDDRGEVVWFYRGPYSIGDAMRLDNGNILYTPSIKNRRAALTEIDMLGNIVRRWHARTLEGEAPEGSILVDTDSFHHATDVMPSGNILAISTEIRTYEQFPGSDSDPDAPKASRQVVGDIIVEFSRDGAILHEWKLLDLLDPLRVTYGSFGGGFWRGTYAGIITGGMSDWAHTNAIQYIAADHSVLLSHRNQDVIMKLDLAASKISWMLGDHAGWKEPWQAHLLQPKGEFRWPYHQHATRITGRGTILMYDNGNNGAAAFEPKVPREEIYSRAVEYEVDPATMEVKEVWSYGGPGDEAYFCSFLGDADWLPIMDNVLITDGARTDVPAKSGDEEPRRHNWARIVEVTRTSPAEKVFELRVDDTPPQGWRIYRAMRIPSLYASKENR